MILESQLKTILLLSSWGTGSTAITGYLDKLGAYSCPPHFHTNDAKTPNSYEPVELRNLLNEYVNEYDFKLKKDPKNFERAFSNWVKIQSKEASEKGITHLVLKHPLLVFFLPTIYRYCDPIGVYITRDIEKVESTRQRRQWPENFGKVGALKIHKILYDLSLKMNKPLLQLPFESFTSNVESRLELIRYTGLRPSKEQITDAENWIKR